MLNAEQKKALELALDGKNLFVTGGAGVGKSFTFTEIGKKLVKSGKSLIKLAPTGIAAYRIGGATIHSQLRLDLTPPYLLLQDEKRLERIKKANEDIAREIDVVLLDEVGMVRADLFDLLVEVLGYDKQYILVGDPFQLPPVVKDEDKRLFDTYESEFFFSSRAYSKLNFDIVELTEIYRQKDVRFVETLNRIRTADVTDGDIDYLNYFVREKAAGAITLTTTNSRARRSNEVELSKLPGQKHIFKAVKEGRINIKSYPITEELVLKIGARVVITKNGDGFRNGDLGTVVDIENNAIFVKLDKNGATVKVVRVTFEEKSYIVTEEVLDGKKVKKIETRTVGTVTQYPLKLGYAVTVHKSQGMGITKLHVDLDGAFAPGQTYVALSRATNVNALSLESRIDKSDIIVSSAVKEWYRKNVTKDYKLSKKRWKIRPEELYVAKNYLRNKLQTDYSYLIDFSFTEQEKAKSEFNAVNDVTLLQEWIERYLTKEQINKLRTKLRVERSRGDKALQNITIKYVTRKRLADFAKKHGLTLSEAIDKLIDAYEKL